MEINVEEIEGDGTISVTKHTTCIKRVIGICDSLDFGLDDYISEKVVPVGRLYNLE